MMMMFININIIVAIISSDSISGGGVAGVIIIMSRIEFGLGR